MTSNALALLTTKLVLGASLAFGLASVPQAVAQDSSVCQEDMPCWSCVDDGNRICGPDNEEGKPAGCYDFGGVLVASWPCRVVIDPVTGDSDVYTDDQSIPEYVY